MRVRNPFIGEGLRASFSHPPMLRTYMLFILVMGCCTIFMWPWSPLVSYLKPHDPPLAFAVAAFGMLTCLVFFNGRFGGGDYEPVDSTKVRDFVSLTPVAVSTVVKGKLVVGIVHVLVQLVMGLPFLVVTRAAGGRSYGEMAGIILVAGAAAVAFRSLAFMLFVMLGDNKAFRQVLLVVFASSMLFILPLLPAVSPVAAIASLALISGPGYPLPTVLGIHIPFFLASAIMSLLGVVVFSLISVAWLRRMRRAHAAAAAPDRLPLPGARKGDDVNE